MKILKIETFAWCGIRRYRCPFCQFDGESEAEVQEHAGARHTEALMELMREEEPAAEVAAISEQTVISGEENE